MKTPSLERRILSVPFEEVWAVTPQDWMYHRFFGLRGDLNAPPKAAQTMAQVDAMRTRIIQDQLIKARAVYQVFRARSEADSILVLGEGSAILERFEFPRFVRASGSGGADRPRQGIGAYVCLADAVRTDMDFIGFFAVTTGLGCQDVIDQMNADGQYVDSHVFSSMMLAAAEGLAGFTHQVMREAMGIPRDQGLRFSFGYPMCPDLGYQAGLWRLLMPFDAIGIRLTDGFMMQPEASVSAGVIFLAG